MDIEDEVEGTHRSPLMGTPCSPIGVITRVERRRRWSVEERLRILTEV